MKGTIGNSIFATKTVKLRLDNAIMRPYAEMQVSIYG